MSMLKRLLLELAHGSNLDEAWARAGFAGREEAESALLELAGRVPQDAGPGEPASKAARGATQQSGGLGLVIHVDGASRGNPGPASVAAVARLESGEELTSVSKCIGRATNNVAEYRAVIEGLRLARDLNAERVDMRLDSELVVKQLTGLYRIKNTELQILAEAVASEAESFKACTFTHIPRSENGEADRLANIALDKAAKDQKR